MSQAPDRESRILASYKEYLAAPEAMAKRYKYIAIALFTLGQVVGYISGYLVSEKALLNAGQLLAVLAGLLLGLSALFYINSKQMITFAKFCTLKSQYLEWPNQSTAPIPGAAPPLE